MPKVRKETMPFVACNRLTTISFLSTRSDPYRIKEKVERIGDEERTKMMMTSASLCSEKTARVSGLDVRGDAMW